jgi:hypothetical protein
VERIVLEREFEEPLTAADVRKLAAGTRCLKLYRVKPICSYLMPGGRRMVCIFEAPDAEALRSVSRVNDFRSATVWAATYHPA